MSTTRDDPIRVRKTTSKTPRLSVLGAGALAWAPRLTPALNAVNMALIRARQVAIVYRRLPLALAMSVVISLLFVILLLQALLQRPLLNGRVALYAVSALRAVGLLAHRRAAQAALRT